MRARYFEEWDEDTEIAWWNAGRKKLNVLIRRANEWTLCGAPPEESARILREIDAGLQTFTDEEGGSGWREELARLADYVRDATAYRWVHESLEDMATEETAARTWGDP